MVFLLFSYMINDTYFLLQINYFFIFLFLHLFLISSSLFVVSFFVTINFCLVNAACRAHRKFMLKTYQNCGFVQLFSWEFASLLRRLLLVHLIN
jgi:hypothetical protein